MQLMAFSTLVGSVVLSLAGAANAQVVIHSNFGPGDDFNMVSGNLVVGPDEASIGNVDQAMRFTVGAIDTYFTRAELALRLTDGLDLVNVLLMSDAGGLPDSVLLSMAVSGIPGPDAPGIVTANAGAAVLLSANTTYWIAADAGSDTEIVWHRNSIGEVGRAGRSGTPVGPWNFNPDQETLAFRVSGRLVPAPGFGMLALLAGGAAAVRRRREGGRCETDCFPFCDSRDVRRRGDGRAARSAGRTRRADTEDVVGG